MKKSQLSRRPWMVRISSQDWRSLSCQDDLGWSEFQVKTEEVPVVKKTLDGQNFKSRLKKSQLSEFQVKTEEASVACSTLDAQKFKWGWRRRKVSKATNCWFTIDWYTAYSARINRLNQLNTSKRLCKKIGFGQQGRVSQPVNCPKKADTNLGTAVPIIFSIQITKLPSWSEDWWLLVWWRSSRT